MKYIITAIVAIMLTTCWRPTVQEVHSPYNPCKIESFMVRVFYTLNMDGYDLLGQRLMLPW